jgi:D-aspartate ligase
VIRNTSVPITILQFTQGTHHGGVGIARTAGRLGIRVYWVHGQPRPPLGALSRYVYRNIFLDLNAPAKASVGYLLEQARQIGRESSLIPIDDEAAIFVADHAEALRERFLLPDQPAGLARSLSNKKELYFLCRKMGIPTPQAAFPESRDDVATFAENAVFPIVLKRIASWFPEYRTQMESVTIVNNPNELLKECRKIETLDEPNMMLQEYIPGGPEFVWMFNGYFSNNSECLVSFTGKKIRQSPPFTGPTVLGICLKNEVVEKMTIDFMRRLGYRGIVDMEYRYDKRDGQYKLLDVNPRLGSTFRLFVDSNGMDVMRALYLDLTGQPVQHGILREGRKWIVEQSDLWASLQYGRIGELTLKEWIRSLRGIEERAWFARDDLVPFAAICWYSLVKAGRRLYRIKATRDRKRPGRVFDSVFAIGPGGAAQEEDDSDLNTPPLLQDGETF